MDRVQEIRKILKEFIDYDTGKALRKELHEISKQTYQKKHTDREYLEFFENNEAHTEKVHGQDENHPYYMGLFSVKSQHVYGDSLYECLDKAMK